jgi:FAD:protein FMN transferase
MAGRWSFPFAAGLALLYTSSAPLAQPHISHVEASRMSMACLYAIDAYASGDEKTLRAALDEAFDEVDRIDRLMSHYKPDSPLSQINREAGRREVVVDPELFAFIARSLHYSQETEGAFDITVGPLMKAWGFFRGEGHLPDEGQLAVARRVVGASHVILNRERRTIRFDAEGVELDLGGIAKGYAVDRAVGILRSRNVRAALVSSGGSTVYGLGAPPDRKAWSVDIQDPIDASKVADTVPLNNRSLSVAGSSEKAFEVGGRRYAHIMDPRTGRPVQGMLTVAVLTKTGTEGDALDDALFVLGPSKSAECLKHYPDAEALLFLPDAVRGWTLVRQQGPAQSK